MTWVADGDWELAGAALETAPVRQIDCEDHQKTLLARVHRLGQGGGLGGALVHANVDASGGQSTVTAASMNSCVV